MLDLSQKLVFPNNSGGYIRRQNVNRRDWARIMRKAGLSGMGFTFHDLRHSCATILLRNGETIANVSKRIGHSKISTTKEVARTAPPGSPKPLVDEYAESENRTRDTRSRSLETSSTIAETLAEGDVFANTLPFYVEHAIGCA